MIFLEISREAASQLVANLNHRGPNLIQFVQASGERTGTTRISASLISAV